MAEYDIKITKAGQTVHVDDGTITNDNVYAAIFAEGLKVCLNSKMTKFTGMKELSGDKLAEFQAKVMEVAKKNLADLQAGTFKFPGAKAEKSAAPREVQNEAMRAARDYIRNELRAANVAISHVPAKDITAAAKNLVTSDPKWLAEAKATIEARAKTPTDHIDLSKLGIDISAAKAATDAAKAKKVESGKALSAAKAGQTNKVAGRATKIKPTASTVSDVLAAAKGGASASPAGAIH